MKKSLLIKQRKAARRAAVQAIYRWQVTASAVGDIVAEFQQDSEINLGDELYFQQLITGAIEKNTKIDAAIRPRLDRSLASLNPVELAVLRMAVYELMHCIDVPYKVVINEALDIAKEFGSQDGHKYINAVLDKLAPELRPQS
jgi:transcription antitermination protein NusB